MDDAETAQVVIILGAGITAALNVIALYMTARGEERLDSLATNISELNGRLDRLVTGQFRELLRHIRDLTSNVSDRLVSMDERMNEVVARLRARE